MDDFDAPSPLEIEEAIADYDEKKRQINIHDHEMPEHERLAILRALKRKPKGEK